MSRGYGELEMVQGAFPDGFAVLFGLLTQLGDIWFLGMLLGVLYWYDIPNRVDIVALSGVWLASVALAMSLKEFFSLPRPDRAPLAPERLPGLVRHVYEITAMASGYGFPSGHAVNATLVYVGLAAILGVSSPRRRYLGVVAVVGTVCFTRIALGVHYLVDVVAGIVVGLALLTTVRMLVDVRQSDRTTIAFGFAFLFGVLFLGTTAGDPDALYILGATLGGFAGWQFVLLDVRGRSPSFARALRPMDRGVIVAVFSFVVLVISILALPWRPQIALAGVLGLVVCGIVIVPAVQSRGEM